MSARAGRPARTQPGRSAAAPVGALRVDRIACDGRGLCAELLPERITLDEWGYPLLDPAPVGPALAGAARQAVALCPRLALHLQA